MPFKRIISRDNGTPWGETGMDSRKWLSIPVVKVQIKDLIATQPGVLLLALAWDYDQPSVGGDEYPHVIKWRGELYLEDGHHRVIRRLLAGKTRAKVRLLTVPRRPAKMAVSNSDARDCGWLGCGVPRCEPACPTFPKVRTDFCNLPDCHCDGMTSHP
jgi:hypothetical protein